MNNIKAVIFDLDGTLLNTLDDLADSCNEALETMHYPVRTVDEVRRFVGNGLGKLAERALPDGLNNPDYTAFLRCLRSCYAKNWHNKTRPYDGVLEMLARLSEAGIRTGIVSNKPDAQVKELADLYFAKVIPAAAAIGERESEGIRRKPAPDSTLAVMRGFGVSKENAVYVGDSDVDIETARNAGIPCISVCWGFRPRSFLCEHGATTLVEQPAEILSAVGL